LSTIKITFIILTLLLDENLKGRASKQSRIYDLGSVAQFGFQAPEVKDRAAELLLGSSKVLSQWGFKADSLKDFIDSLEKNYTPADKMIEQYLKTGNLNSILSERAFLK